MDEENTTTSIEDKLHTAWRQERSFFHLRGASRFAIWLIALVALAFLIDWGLFSRSDIHGAVGLLLLLVIVGVLGWVLWHEWLRFLKPFDPVLVALEVERRHPNLSSLLVSYVQLDKPAADQPNVSKELIAAMRDQAVTMARPFDFRDIVDFRQLRNLLMVAVGVLLVFGALSVRWGEHLGTLMQRLVGVDARYPTRTQVVEVSGDMVVRIGDSAVVNAKATGVIPDQGRIFTRLADDDGAEWKELPMKRDAAGNPAFARELKDLNADLMYYVRIGDDRGEKHRIRVIPSPQVVSTHILWEYPGYMKLAARSTDQLNLEVPEGTRLSWQLECDQAVKRFQVKFDNQDEPNDALIDEAGKTLSFAATADESFKYTFRWVERDSGKDFEFDDVQYGVRVVADVAPEVELLRPGTNGLATVKKKLKLDARANDDHGLSKAWLVYSLGGSEEQRVPIRDFGAAKGQEFSHEWDLQTGVKDLLIGSQITFAIEVSDHYPDEEGHLRRSATRQLTIVDPERYLEWYRTELAAQTAEIRRSREAEKTAASKVREIKIQEDPTQ